MVHITNFFSFVPEFIFQVLLAHESGKKKALLSAIRDSLLVPPLSFQTGIIVIYQSRLRTFPSAFHVSTETDARPWGFTLEGCFNCKTNRYLEWRADKDTDSRRISCSGCNSNGTVNRPGQGVFQVLPIKGNHGFWIRTLPDSNPLSVTWKKQIVWNFIVESLPNNQEDTAVWLSL